jgi:anti-sigma regulatory factor (Ser/Thr protein kinase)
MVLQTGQVGVSGMNPWGMSGSIRPVCWAGHGEVRAASVVLLPYAPSSVATARGQLATDLREAGTVAAAIGDAALVLSELLSNAIRHARPLPGCTVRVAWTLCDGTLRVSVSDGGGPALPRAGYPSLSALGGRGLAIVEHLSSNWGIRSSNGRITVWAVLPAPGSGDIT